MKLEDIRGVSSVAKLDSTLPPSGTLRIDIQYQFRIKSSILVVRFSQSSIPPIDEIIKSKDDSNLLNFAEQDVSTL